MLPYRYIQPAPPNPPTPLRDSYPVPQHMQPTSVTLPLPSSFPSMTIQRRQFQPAIFEYIDLTLDDEPPLHPPPFIQHKAHIQVLHPVPLGPLAVKKDPTSLSQSTEALNASEPCIHFWNSSRVTLSSTIIPQPTPYTRNINCLSKLLRQVAQIETSKIQGHTFPDMSVLQPISHFITPSLGNYNGGHAIDRDYRPPGMDACWYCCTCPLEYEGPQVSGPHDVDLYVSCVECGHNRCAKCWLEVYYCSEKEGELGMLKKPFVRALGAGREEKNRVVDKG